MRRQLVPTGQFPPGQIQRFQRNDPFQHIQQMMMSFGGMHNDPFMSSLMGFRGGDPFQDMFNFSDIHKNMHSRGSEGSFVMQSFVSSSRMGPDGKIIRQDYFENNMGQHMRGNTISQKQQAYKNTQGVNRIAEQRMLNDRGRKIMREKIGNNYQETNHYYNIDEEEAEKFDSQWKQEDKNQRFLEEMKKRINYMEPQLRQIVDRGYQQQHQQYQPSSNVPQLQAIRYQQPRMQQNYTQPSQQRYVQPSNYGQSVQSNYPQHFQTSHTQGMPRSTYRPTQNNFGVQGQGYSNYRRY